MSGLTQRVSAKTYYDYFPPAEHSPGDIWTNLPMHGLLKRSHVSGIVVTPSCDLSNSKVSTVTYLPIVPVLDWLCSRDFSSEIIGWMKGVVEQLSSLGIETEALLSSGGTDVAAAESSLAWLMTMSGARMKKVDRAALDRFSAGVRHLGRSANGYRVDKSDLRLCLGKKRWESVCQRIPTNALRTDLHFLPADENQDKTLSPVPVHSVVMFRCPLTAPASVFDLAQDVSMTDWSASMAALKSQEPMARAFMDTRPIKCLRLQERFRADLLTRYSMLYSRLGSPDFSQDTLDRFATELDCDA